VTELYPLLAEEEWDVAIGSVVLIFGNAIRK